MSIRNRARNILAGTFRAAAWTALASAIALPVAASSPDDPKEARDAVGGAKIAEGATAGTIRVTYDPESGEIISVPGRKPGVLSEALARALTRSTEGMQVFELENGGKGVHLGGRFQHAYMVRIRPDGTLETYCTEHSHEAEAFLKSRMSGAVPASRNK